MPFLPFWLFVAAYKFAAVLHYSLLSPLGARLLPFWIVGLAIGGESFAQMLLDVPAGFLVDRFGRRRMLALGTLVFVCAALLFTRFSVETYLASIALSTIGWLFMAPGVNAYVLSYAKRETSGRFIALRDTFFSTGVVLASISLPFVLRLAPPSMGYVMAGIFVLALAFLAASPSDQPVVRGQRTLPAEPYHIRRTQLATSLKALRQLNPASGMLCVYSIAGAVFYGGIWFVVPLVIAQHLGAGMLGLGLGIFDATIVLLGYAIGNLVDRGDKRLLVFWGLFVFAFMGVVLGSMLGPLFLLFGFLATTGDETAGLSLWSWLHALDKEHAHDGAVAGVISFSEDLGYAIGPVFVGFLYAALGPAWTIAAGAVPLVLAWGAYAIFVKHRVLPMPLLADIPRMPQRRRHKS